MAVTRQGPIYIMQGAAAGSAPTKVPDPLRSGEFLHVSPFFYDQEEIAETDLTVELLRLPAGKIEVYPTKSRLIASDMVATADLSLGHAAYNDPGNNDISVAADLVKWANAIDIGGAAKDVAWDGTDPQEFNTTTGLLIQSLVATADIDLDDEIRGWVVWRFQA